MFENEKIGIKDINGKEVREGNKIRFKLSDESNWVEGTVRYATDTCAFCIEFNKDEAASIFFTVGIKFIEIIE